MKAPDQQRLTGPILMEEYGGKKKIYFTNRENKKEEVTLCGVCLCNSFHGTRKLTQDSFPVNRTRIAYAVCTFCRFSERAGYASPSFTANSIKALGAVLIGRLYFWLSSSLVFAAFESRQRGECKAV